MLFFGLFFLRVLWFCGWFFCVFGKVAKVLKMIVFSQIWGLLWGGLFLFFLDLEGLGVFVVLVCVFSFVQFLLLFVLALLLDCCFFGPKPSLCFVSFFLAFLGGFFVFLFLFLFGGFKGQVKWPKGPPHLALNPLYFLFFCVIVWLSCLCV